MSNLLNRFYNTIVNALDPFSELRQSATDRNVILVSNAGKWYVVDGLGHIKSEADTPANALAISIYKI